MIGQTLRKTPMFADIGDEALANLAAGRAKPRRPDVAKDFRTFQDVCGDHVWVEVVKVPRSHPKMRIPDRYSKEGAALAKRRAQGKRAGPRWERIYARGPARGYREGHR